MSHAALAALADVPASVDPLHKDMASAIRALAMDAVERAKSGHPGMPMGMADVATVLWTKFLRFDAANPGWPDRDRFILSGGHGSMLLYALAHLAGFQKMTMEEIKNFRQLGSHTAGHPERDVDLGIEMTTGPLGQGIAHATGFALAERMLNARFGDGLVDHRTFVMCGDGDLMEGVSAEAASLAGHLKLGRLIVYYDDNNISIDGETALSFTEDVQARYRAYGWHVQSVNGHDPDAIEAATNAALAVADKPSLIACRTVIGFGAPKKQGTHGCHGSPLGAEEIAAARAQLGWPHEPFVIPADILSAWRAAGARGQADVAAWAKRHAAHAGRAAFDAAMSGDIPVAATQALAALKQKIAAEKPKFATRQSSGAALDALIPVFPELAGGSADLTPSNNTHVKGMEDIAPGSYGGRYIRYGVREHGMAAAMGGLALHGGVIPYGGTFMQFADYARPAIRLAALMHLRVIYIMTHDSIGLGEDGPTHQPVEHLAALRAIPNLLVMRPCDTIETAECWAAALANKTRPSLMALSRQGLPTLRGADAENRAARGAYVLAGGDGKRDVTILATGSEVSLAMEARAKLAEQGVAAAVVSMPCWELFEEQSADYRASVLGTAPRVAVEAGIRQGWDYYLGANGAFVGMAGFGASAPAEKLYAHFGITADAVAAAAKKLLG
ncbi:MAG: transketolase [Alphaproteobacteria bacterium]|nr:transketolase [Alphaproteobacteria bacterium]